MGFAKALLKIIGGTASAATLEPLSIVSGLCSVASGTMEMKDVIDDFISQVSEITGSGLAYIYKYYKTGEDPYQIMGVMKEIKKMLEAKGVGYIFSLFESALTVYAYSKGDFKFSV